MQGIERIQHGEQLLAIVIRAHATPEQKYNFLTDQQNALQLGINTYTAGEVIPAHAHLGMQVSVASGQEFIYLKAGRLKVTLYDAASRAAVSVLELAAGDMILLISGGHGFDVLEPCQIVEVKQGPYLSKEKDKVVWSS